jgi:hypothetical protein
VRRVRVVFNNTVEVDPTLPGVTDLKRSGAEMEFDFAGDLSTLLDWLGSQPVQDLQLRPLGLASIYQRYHGVES